jgi:hypothetical protein
MFRKRSLNSVSVKWLRNCASIPDRGRRPFVLQCVQTGSESHPASSLLNDYGGWSRVEVKKEWISTSSRSRFHFMYTDNIISYMKSQFIYAFLLLTENNKSCRHAGRGRNGIHFDALKHRMTSKSFSQSVGSKSHVNSPWQISTGSILNAGLSSTEHYRMDCSVFVMRQSWRPFHGY